MNEATTSVECTFNESDLIDAQRAWWTGETSWQAFAQAIGVFWLVCGLALIGVEMAAGGWAAIQRNWWIAVLVAGALAVGRAVLRSTLTFLLIPQRARKIFRENQLLRDPNTHRWDAEHLYITTSHTSSKMPWALFHAWLDGPKSLLLLRGGSLFNLMPKRALAPEQVAEIVGYLRAAKVPEKKRFGLLASPVGK